MRLSTYPRLASLLASGLVFSALLPPPAQGQAMMGQGNNMMAPGTNMFRSPPPSAANLPAAYTQAVLQSTAAAAPGFLGSNPLAAYGGSGGYGGYGGYGYMPYIDYGPVGGYLFGAASVISSQGQFAINQQQAIKVREDIKTARITNRQRAMEQYLWERQNLPTLQDDREREQALEFRRAKTQPPATEIWSGKSLNDILAEITNTENANGVRGPLVPLDDETLRHVNLTAGVTQGTPSLVRDGRVPWPALLRRPAFNRDRERIDQLVGDLGKQAAGGALDSGSLDTAVEATNALREQVRGSAGDLAAGDYIQAVRFLTQLQDTWAALQQPGAAKLLAGGRLGPQVATVGDLVDQLNRQGVRFAPAARGDEEAYNALYQALLAYDVGLTRLAAK
jgi:hypothetical protein